MTATMVVDAMGGRSATFCESSGQLGYAMARAAFTERFGTGQDPSAVEYPTSI